MHIATPRSRYAPFLLTLLSTLALTASTQAQAQAQVTVNPNPVCQGDDLAIQWNPISLLSGLTLQGVYLYKGNSTGSLIALPPTSFAANTVWDVPADSTPGYDYYIQVLYSGFTIEGFVTTQLTSSFFEISDCRRRESPADDLAEDIEDFEEQLFREYWLDRGGRPRPPWGPDCTSCPYNVDMLGLYMLLDSVKMDEPVNVLVRDPQKTVFADYGTLKPTGYGFQGLPRHTIVKPPQGLKRGKNCGFTLEVNDLKNQNIASTDVCLVGSP